MTMHRDLVTPRGLLSTGLAAALGVAGPSAALATETEEPDQPECGFEVPAYDVTPVGLQGHSTCRPTGVGWR